MFKFIKNFNWIILSSFLCIFLGILTFLTFINQGPIKLTDNNLQILLVVDIILLIIFFYLIFSNVFRLYKTGKRNKSGSQTNLKYISLFSLFTFIPSLLVAVFSLFIFNFGVQNYFDDQITKAVNNSYDVAKNYLNENRENVKSDVILMGVGLNRASNLFYTNPNRFQSIIKAEKLLRRVDEVYLIDSAGNILFRDRGEKQEEFIIPLEENFNQALDGNVVLLSNNLENKTAAMIKLSSLIDTYLYISRNIDDEILKYLQDTEEAVSFYYSVENSQTGIKITFAIIYIIVVTLLLFLSTSLAITFATRLTRPIVNLIEASDNISKGALDTKVPEMDSDEEFKMLNRNFNNMIDRLKKQQEKLLASERYSAWETVARKLAHEIKNPLTPIQLSIERLEEKYSSKLQSEKTDFQKYLQTINRQIKDIEELVNEFSNFARMPRPVFKKIDLAKTISRSIDLLNLSIKNKINFIQNSKANHILGDKEQLNRVFLNLIKNADESINEKLKKTKDFKGKIDIEIAQNNDYIVVTLTDNGIGFSNTKKAMTPYYTTKVKGTGLGLPIVLKIIDDHSGEFLVDNKINDGALISIKLPKIYE